jgi:hypothetical protein
MNASHFHLLLSQSDDFIFIDNEQEERFKHFSNWETVGSRTRLKI